MEAYIVEGYRTAVAKAKKGGFKNYRSDDMAVDVLKHLVGQVPALDPTTIDDVIVGCANPEGEQGLQVGRLISARALGIESLLRLWFGSNCNGRIQNQSWNGTNLYGWWNREHESDSHDRL